MSEADIQAKVTTMKNVAKWKAHANAGKPNYLLEIEDRLDTIGKGAFALEMTWVNENLFGIAQLLLAECKRLKSL